MSEPVDLPDMQERLNRVIAATRRVGGGGPTSGGGDDMDHRVTSLERAFQRMDDKLDKLIEGQGAMRERLASIEGKLETKASAADLAKMQGRVESLPTTWQMIALVFGILGGAFAILKFGLPHAP